MRLLLLNLLFISFAAFAQQQDFRSLTPTPPMGWNSYDCYGVCVNEKQVLDNAQYMAEHLMKYGWEYVVIDGSWSNYNSFPEYYPTENTEETKKKSAFNIDRYGRLIPSIEKFPSSANGKGFKPLADKVHKMGLKFGLHMMRGIPKAVTARNCPISGDANLTTDMVTIKKNSCGWCPSYYELDLENDKAQKYYNSIFNLYAEWGVDFVKVDDCSSPYREKEIEIIRKAIDQCGRPMVLSLSPGETPLKMGAHVASHANMWRVVNDLWDNWGQLKNLILVTANWSPYIGNGTWPDCDMLPLGRIAIKQHPANGKERNSNLSTTEQYTLMSLTAIAKSPLMFGGALTHLDKFTESLITNREILEVNQHSTGNRVVCIDTEKQIWMAEHPKKKCFYVVLFNISDNSIDIDADMAQYGKAGKYKIKELWSGKLSRLKGHNLKCRLKPHESKFFKFSL